MKKSNDLISWWDRLWGSREVIATKTKLTCALDKISLEISLKEEQAAQELAIKHSPLIEARSILLNPQETDDGFMLLQDPVDKKSYEKLEPKQPKVVFDADYYHKILENFREGAVNSVCRSSQRTDMSLGKLLLINACAISSCYAVEAAGNRMIILYKNYAENKEPYPQNGIDPITAAENAVKRKMRHKRRHSV